MSKVIFTTLALFLFGCSDKDEDTGDTGLDTAEENLTGDE